MSRIDELIQDLCPDGVEYVDLDSVVRIRNGSDYKALGAGDVPVYGSGGVMTSVDTAVHDGPSVLIPRKGSLGNLFYLDEPFWTVDTIFYTEIDATQLIPKFFYYVMFMQRLAEKNQAGGVPSMTQSYLKRLRIPVPPLEVQREIVRVLDKFTQLEAELEAELEARRTQYEHYRAEFLTFKEEVPRRRLDEVAVYANGKAHERLVVDGAEIPLVTARFISRNGEANRYVPLADVLTPGRTGDVALVLSDLPNGRALARTFFVDRDDSYAINQRVARITVKETAEMNPKFLHFLLDRNRGLLKHDNGVDQTHLSKGQVTGLTIPVPSIEEQNRIVDRLERFDGLVNDISIGLPAELAARRKQYEHYRDRLLTFKELTV